MLQVDLVRWMIIHLPRDTRLANKFAGMMQKVGQLMEIQVGDAYMTGLKDESAYVAAEHNPHPAAGGDHFSECKGQ
jgi:hypothetical protein